jgi:acetyl-CoA carboxylase / biotin carboxylase 1
MEAKGCAKACVWKNARRCFYWALRARLARSYALAQLEAASPKSTYEYRNSLLEGMVAHVDPSNHERMTEALEALNLTETLTHLRNTEVARQMAALLQSNRKSALDGLVRIAHEVLSDEERGALLAALQPTGAIGELGLELRKR